ncbi:hypothetical protein ACA910_020154 [Epithemia clementina (nom. ined.)]
MEELVVLHAGQCADNSNHPSIPVERKDAWIRDAITYLKTLPPLLQLPPTKEAVAFEGYLLLADMYMKLQTFDTAEEIIREMIAYSESKEDFDSETSRRMMRVEPWLKLARSLEGQERWTEALDCYRHVQSTESKGSDDGGTCIWVDIMCGIARCQANCDDLPGAQETVQHMLSKTPRAKGASLEHAYVLEKAGQLEKARSEFLKAAVLENPWDSLHRQRNLENAERVTELIERRDELRLMEEEFRKTWGRVLDFTKTQAFAEAPKTWSVIQIRFEITGGYDSDDENEDLRASTAERLTNAAAAAARTNTEEEDDHTRVESGAVPLTDTNDVDVFEDAVVETNVAPVANPFEYGSIKLTKEILKWLKESDSKFKALFIKKIEKLAQGDWGYTTAKLLKGSNTKIYETYLEQKSGHRILWTRPSGTLLIWYVAAHKKVSRYMGLIDDAGKRSKRQLVPATDAFASDLQHDTGDIMLDLKADVPLKLYELSATFVGNLNHATWRPPMHMTPRERDIVDSEGSVCVLGRSGTGKTVCIASRIHNDRHKYGASPEFSQLFVARSRRICEYVKESVGKSVDNDRGSLEYWTYRKLLLICEEELCAGSGYSDRLRMDFHTFKARVHNTDCGLDPMVSWTQIRSFIKGSVAAVSKGRHLLREEYMGLGTRHCRLNADQRGLAYDVFEKYERICRLNKFWDDNDRVARILNALKTPQSYVDEESKIHRSRLYVDEVQDFTQAEIALFFSLCRPGGLFLAGDPAQSVEEGTDFRFEDIRVVADMIYSSGRENHGKSNKSIPEKPKMLKVNFRSHAGVLNLAAGILDNMFDAFPGSFKELPRDEGFFRGPRPCVVTDLSWHDLKELVGKLQGVAVLSMEESKISRLQDFLGDETSVLSIRESKGLEFDVVLIVDFFLDLTDENQRCWKKLFLNDDKSDIQASAPELEAQLKQFYTAVTRCCKRLLFVETCDSMAFDAFKKWAYIRRERETRLIDLVNITNVEGNVMTVEQWTKNGLKFAIYAEDSSNLEVAKRNLKRAMENFREGDDQEALQRADTHFRSIELREQLNSEDIKGKNIQPYVDAILSLMQCGLLLEASKLCHAVVDRMGSESMEYAREQLSTRLLGLLPDLDF